jgi:hypothetical protein
MLLGSLMMEKKINYKNRLENKKHPSLFEVFKLGDRVKITYFKNNGNLEDYSGLIMSIYNDSIDIFWDKLNGKYQPQKIENMFTNCKLKDIFYGNKNYSPIKKEKYTFKDIIKRVY